MKASTKIWRVVLGAIFILAGFGAIGKYSFWVVLICFAIGAALIPWKGFQKPKQNDPVKSAADPDDVALAGKACRYSYEHVGLYRPEGVEPMPPLGATLILEREEDNPYDPEAIRAVQWTKDGVKVYGYMNKGKLRDMVSDFIDRSDPILTKVTRADDKLEIWIGMP